MYLMIACMQMYPGVDLRQAYKILPIVLMFTNWELVRKIRSPQQETAYTTYSKIMGPRLAAAVAIALQLIFISTVLLIFRELHKPLWLVASFSLLQLLLLAPSVYFLLSLRLPRPLKPMAEAQILLVVGGLLVAAML
jgi:hypothetical protein